MPVRSLTQKAIGEYTIVKQADQDVTNSSTLTNDTELKLAVKANTSYKIELFLVYSGDAATGDYQWAFQFPTALYRGYRIGWTNADASSGMVGLGLITSTTSTSIQALGTDGADTMRQDFAKFFLRVLGTGGTLQFQFSQQTPVAATHARTRAGTVLWVKEFPNR